MDKDDFVIARALDYYALHMKEAADMAAADEISAAAQFMQREAEEAERVRARILNIQTWNPSEHHHSGLSQKGEL